MIIHLGGLWQFLDEMIVFAKDHFGWQLLPLPHK
jgi:hypothetical protein